MSRHADRPIDSLDNRHLMSMILYIRENGPCRRIELYENISKGANMPRKFQQLMDMGVVRIEDTDSGEFLLLTDSGERIAESLIDIEDNIRRIDDTCR